MNVTPWLAAARSAACLALLLLSSCPPSPSPGTDASQAASVPPAPDAAAPSYRLAGIVLRGETPVANAQVDFLSGRKTASTVSNAEGRFSFEALPTAIPGLAWATLDEEISAAERATPTREGAQVRLALGPAVSVQGRILDEKGAPVPGVQVSTPLGEKTAVTDAEGRYRLGPISRSISQLSAKAMGFVERTLERQESQTTVDVALVATVSIAGSVVDSAGKPVEDAVVGSRDPERVTRSNSLGHFQLLELAPTTREFYVRHPDFQPFAPKDVKLPAHDVRWVLKPAAAPK